MLCTILKIDLMIEDDDDASVESGRIQLKREFK